MVYLFLLLLYNYSSLHLQLVFGFLPFQLLLLQHHLKAYLTYFVFQIQHCLQTVLLLVYYIVRLESAFPVYSVLPITIVISAPGLAVPVILVLVFNTSSIVICSSFAFTTSTIVSTLTILSLSFCVTVILVSACCTGISRLHLPCSSTFPVYCVPPIFTNIVAPISPEPDIFLSSFVIGFTIGFALSFPSCLNLSLILF